MEGGWGGVEGFGFFGGKLTTKKHLQTAARLLWLNLEKVKHVLLVAHSRVLLHRNEVKLNEINSFLYRVKIIPFAKKKKKKSG